MRFVCLIVIKEVDFRLVVYKDNIGYGYLGYKVLNYVYLVVIY